MSEDFSWTKHGYKKLDDVEIRPVMAPNHASVVRGEAFVDSEGNAFSYSDKSIYFGKMKEKKVMVYDDTYIGGDFHNDFNNMVNFLKDYMKDGKAFLKSDEQIEDFSVYFLRKILEEN